MPFYFTCPYCLHKTLVSEALSGQAGACVGCGKQVTIPPPPARRRTDIAPAQERHETHPAQLQPHRQVPRWLVRGVLYGLPSVPLVIFVLWLASPALATLRAQRNLIVCQQNLKRIAKALNSYAADHGTYPPAAILDSRGIPMHSWRVLILPYLGERKLYELYDMSKPWDAPENAGFQGMIPAVYVSPGNTNPAVGEASYMLVTGPKTLFPPAGPLRPSDVRDGPGNTLLVVETSNRLRAWTEPADLNFATLPPSIGAVTGIGGSHDQGATAVLADETPIFLPGDTTKQMLDGLITPNGGETVSGSWYK